MTTHTTIQKIQLVCSWRDYGITRLQYCRLHGLSSHAFHEWLRPPEERVSVTEYPVLLPVCVQQPPEPAPAISTVLPRNLLTFSGR